ANNREDLVWRAYGARPDQLAAQNERMVYSPPQRLPAQRGVRPVELIPGVGPGAVAAREGAAQIHVGGFAQIPVQAQVADRGKVAALIGAEQVFGVAAEYLGRTLQEDAFRRGQDTAERKAGVN